MNMTEMATHLLQEAQVYRCRSCTNHTAPENVTAHLVKYPPQQKLFQLKFAGVCETCTRV